MAKGKPKPPDFASVAMLGLTPQWAELLQRIADDRECTVGHLVDWLLRYGVAQLGYVPPRK